MREDHAREHTVIDGFDGLLLQAAVVELDAVIHLQDLHYLSFLLLALRLDQQARQLFQFLVVDTD